MAFKNPSDSHAHSQNVLNLLYEYDSFLDSINVVADFGCGSGLDAKWWATLATRDETPEPRNYIVYGIDTNIGQVDASVTALPNVHLFEKNFENDIVIPRQCDLLWSHDSFQYAVNPMQTLALWNQQMNVNGMLVLSIPVTTFYQYNKIQVNSHNGGYHNYDIVNLMYMLGANGFDCRDAYFYKPQNEPWIYAAVYKASEPLDPRTTSWHTLAEMNMISDKAKESLNTYNYVRQTDLVTLWLDKDFHRVM
jgi:SAM-dependent methyltransferase